MTTPTNLYSVEGVQAKFREGLACLDGQLSQYKYANEIERKTGVPKSYIALGGGALVFIMIFFNLAGQLLTNTISWVYPGKILNASFLLFLYFFFPFLLRFFFFLPSFFLGGVFLEFSVA